MLIGHEYHVLHTVPRLFSRHDGIIGGAERYALELARHMAAEIPTSLVSFGDVERQETIGQLKIHVIGNPWCIRGEISNPISFQLYNDLRKADVVHCHQQHILASSCAALFCRLTGRRVFVSDLGGGGWDLSAFVATDNWYDGHLHISEYSRSVFGHALRSSAHVILGGVDVQKFIPDPGIVRERKVLFVGRLMPHKGIDVLIKALPETLELEIIGQPYDDRYFRDLERLAFGKRVTFRHDCTDEDLVRAYQRAMCVVLPSVYKTMYGDEGVAPELLGQTPLEAMACEAPAICTKVASLPEVVQDGVTGFVVPPNDPESLGERIAWLSDHAEQRQVMGRLARSRVLEVFTWPAVVRRCLGIYEASLPNRKKVMLARVAS
jgi:glycosyltransferase involved in cell wall biosynthesis